MFGVLLARAFLSTWVSRLFRRFLYDFALAPTLVLGLFFVGLVQISRALVSVLISPRVLVRVLAADLGRGSRSNYGGLVLHEAFLSERSLAVYTERLAIVGSDPLRWLLVISVSVVFSYAIFIEHTFLTLWLEEPVAAGEVFGEPQVLLEESYFEHAEPEVEVDAENEHE